MIFDENNDEDLSNDSIKKLKNKSFYHSSLDITNEIKYFDGTGLFEYNKYDYIWIDVNQNTMYDLGIDYYEQMYLPFTLKGNSYIVNKIDRFGNTINLAVCNPDSIPPIEEGLLLPDFTDITIDSTEIKFSDYEGKFVILDFWACNRGLDIIKEFFKEFKNNNEIKIISYGNSNNDSTIVWPHVEDDLIGSTRQLLQVSCSHTTMIINPEGVILYIKVNPSKDEIINFLI